MKLIFKMKKINSDPYFKFLQELANSVGKGYSEEQIRAIANKIKGFDIQTRMIQELFHSEKGGFFYFRFESYYKYIEILELQLARKNAKEARIWSFIAVAIAMATLVYSFYQG